MSQDITVDEWLKALEDVREMPDGAFTIEDMALHLRRSTGWVRTKLKQGLRDGQLKVDPVKVQRVAMDGSHRHFTAYRVTVIRRSKRR